MMRNTVGALLASSALLLSALPGMTVPAAAQEYPVKPVKIVIGYPPGGVPDLLARRLGQKLTQTTGQAFVVDNKPGAGTTLASGLVAKSPADGYTLMITDAPTHVMAAFQVKNLPYHPLKDFTAVARLVDASLVLVANAATPIRTVQDLMREARANPGKINYGSTGVGGLHHLVMEYFTHGAGITLTHIPYKGSSQSVPAVVTGEVSVLFTGLQAVAPHIKAGKLVVLGVASTTRLAGMPDIPSLAEVVKDFDYPAGIGMLAPAGMPRDVLTRLSGAVRQAMESPDMTEALRGMSMTATPGSPEEYAEYLQRTLKVYAMAAKLAKIQPE
jgi:tripartite-type tricarboxylate transporter receptor subunit TctC